MLKTFKNNTINNSILIFLVHFNKINLDTLMMCYYVRKEIRNNWCR